MQHELIAADALAEVADHRQAPRRGILLLHREQREAAPGALGVVHREVGAAQEIVDVVAVHGHERDADADADLDALAEHDEGLPEGLLDLPDHGRGPGHVGAGRQEHAELVAAEAGDGVGLAQARDEALAHELQQHVAVVVAERVVHALEPIEVEHHQRERLPRCGPSR